MGVHILGWVAMKSLFRIYTDTDKDGVLDFKDCRPFNPLLQHVKPNKLMSEDIKKLPIYVEDKSGYSYPLFSKDAEKYAPRARVELLSSIKKNPWLIKDIRKASKKKGYKYVHKPLPYQERTAMNIREKLFTDQPKMFDSYKSLSSLSPFVKAYEKRMLDSYSFSKKPSIQKRVSLSNKSCNIPIGQIYLCLDFTVDTSDLPNNNEVNRGDILRLTATPTHQHPTEGALNELHHLITLQQIHGDSVIGGVVLKLTKKYITYKDFKSALYFDGDYYDRNFIRIENELPNEFHIGDKFITTDNEMYTLGYKRLMDGRKVLTLLWLGKYVKGALSSDNRPLGAYFGEGFGEVTVNSVSKADMLKRYNDGAGLNYFLYYYTNKCGEPIAVPLGKLQARLFY